MILLREIWNNKNINCNNFSNDVSNKYCSNNNFLIIYCIKIKE